MALIKREPLKEVEDLFDRYTLSLPWPFGRGSSAMAGAAAPGWTDWHPRVDIIETDTGYEVRADIPGVRKEDLRVTHQDGVLTVQGERRQEQKEESERMHRVERLYGSFSRSFRLPEDADISALQAQANEGQLTITVPRRGPAPREEAVHVPVQ
jgi:HSP20 family protein